MTELMYFEDCYVSEFDAKVLRVGDETVVLDRTAFYPQGGGQPGDVGTITCASGAAEVTKVRKEGRDVLHQLRGPIPLVGEEVRGSIDWDTRYAHMRHHTAQHLLSAYFLEEYGAVTSGNQIWKERARIDFDLPELTSEMIEKAEDQINSWVENSVPVTITLMPRHEALKKLDPKRTRIDLLPKFISTLRIVEVEGIDAVACAGTHVRNTSEIGRFRVTRSSSKGKGRKRLEFVLE